MGDLSFWDWWWGNGRYSSKLRWISSILGFTLVVRVWIGWGDAVAGGFWGD